LQLRNQLEVQKRSKTSTLSRTQIHSGASANRDLGLHFSISFPITPVIWAIINPGFYHGDTFGGSRVRLIPGESDPQEVLRVKTLTFENQPFGAYNLEVGEDHTFFVGTTRAWVHNICASVNNGVLYLKNKFSVGSAEDAALQQHVGDWNQAILNQGGSMTRQAVTPAMRAQADQAAAAAKQANPSLYPSGMAPGHTPDVGWGGNVQGPINPLNATVNSYVGGTTQAVTPGTTYNSVVLYR
jgi:hypothetical protein